MQRSQIHLSHKKNMFSQIFSPFFESALNFELFQNKMTLIAYVFLKLPTTKDVLRSMSKRSRLRGPLDRRHGKPAENVIQF